MAQYWWLVVFLVTPLIVVLVLRFMKKGKAKETASKWLSGAENLVFRLVEFELATVYQKVYNVIVPNWIKSFIPYGLFASLAVELYRKIRGWIENVQKKFTQ